MGKGLYLILPVMLTAVMEFHGVAAEIVTNTRDRIIFSSTALSPDKGELSATGYAAGLWDIQYSFNENLTAGAYVNLPFYVIGAFPHITLNTRISEHWSVGGGAITGIIGPYIDNPEQYYLFMAGGHLAATGTYGRHLFNINTTIAAVALHEKDYGLDFSNGALIIPNAGYRYSINGTWSFLAEAATVIGTAGSADMTGKYWFILYGLRVAGETVFGDFGFCFPAFKEYLRETWKYTPLGIPYFTIGVKF
ncbi:MAG: hypothetical protein CVV44_01785 [Spirochaetae bacterium HGW-Spirochaetae-1]|jgi:hypothetical protein|nr:MAG: hypothetical protein CVV44_01785 [Spirochaetae bacterium HGW-Spirochaetae-1]